MFQIRGRSFLGVKINKNTRNVHDGCVQCLPTGPDTLPSQLHIRTYDSDHHRELLFSPVTCHDTGRPDYFKVNKNFRRSKGNWKTANVLLNSIVANWVRPRKKIPSEQTTLFIVISSQIKSDRELECKSFRKVNPMHETKYFLPFLSSAMDTSSPFVKFHCLSPEDMKELKKLSKSGITAGIDGKEFDDYVSSHFSSHHVELLCVDDICSNNDKNKYHHTSNVYAGGSTLEMVDNTFTEILLPNKNMKAHYKFASSKEYQDQVPLSSAFFDSNFHKFKLSSHHARIFIGKNDYHLISLLLLY